MNIAISWPASAPCSASCSRAAGRSARWPGRSTPLPPRCTAGTARPTCPVDSRSRRTATRWRSTAARSPAGSSPISFRIDGPDGQPVTTYEVEHGKQLHLIVVRRDYTGFQHVHPVLDGGTWTSPALDLTAGRVAGVRGLHADGGRGADAGRRPARAGRCVRRRRRPPRPALTRWTATRHAQRRAARRSGIAADTDDQPRRQCRSTTSSPTSARTATWWRCARATSPTCTSIPLDGAARTRDLVRRRGAERRSLSPVPRLPARRSGAHCAVRRRRLR